MYWPGSMSTTEVATNVHFVDKENYRMSKLLFVTFWDIFGTEN